MFLFLMGEMMSL